MSHLAREKSLTKFSTIVASISVKNIASALADVLEKILVFKPHLEAMVTVKGQLVFREDWHYYVETPEGPVPYHPFVTAKNVPGDVKCQEDIHLYLSKSFLESVWHSLDYVYIPNPLLGVMVADFLTVLLNEDQVWVKRHGNPLTHFMQNYTSLEKLVTHKVPQMLLAYQQMFANIHAVREDFVVDLAEQKGKNFAYLDQKEIGKIYEVRGRKDEDGLIQDFWDLPEIQESLNDIQIAINKIIISVFPTVREAGERSSLPAYGYDVFSASVEGPRIVVRCLGDYRILYWELD